MDQTALLAEEFRLAFAYARPQDRAAWTTLATLDQRLGEIVKAAREPLLAQIKLTWWRDQLREENPGTRASEPLLTMIAEQFPGAGEHLASLAEGWACLLTAEQLSQETLRNHVEGRAAGFCALLSVPGVKANVAELLDAARWWILGDCVAGLPDGERQDMLPALAGSLPRELPRLPRPLRPLAILAALGKHAVAIRAPVLSDRTSALIALRVGMFGR